MEMETCAYNINYRPYSGFRCLTNFRIILKFLASFSSMKSKDITAGVTLWAQNEVKQFKAEDLKKLIKLMKLIQSHSLSNMLYF